MNARWSCGTKLPRVDRNRDDMTGNNKYLDRMWHRPRSWSGTNQVESFAKVALRISGDKRDRTQ
jgi:hypothetical protein